MTDGDSLRLNGTRIRLWGIDAPELQQTCQRGNTPWPCGREATATLSTYIADQADQTVSCYERDVDRYGRIVAECFVGGINLNEWLVQHGWALAYRNYSTKFIPAEKEAQSARLVLWQGSFTEPWEWRRSQR